MVGARPITAKKWSYQGWRRLDKAEQQPTNNLDFLSTANHRKFTSLLDLLVENNGAAPCDAAPILYN